VLKGVISQRLMPSADGKSRVPAVEVMVTTAFIRDCIVDKEKTSQINGAIAAGTSQYGMQTFDQAIFQLYSQGLVSLEEALRSATNVDDFKLKVSGISTTSDMARDEMASKLTTPGKTTVPGPTGARAIPAKPAGPPTKPGGPPTIDRFGGR
jgi:twitching motility protein PilT